MLFPVAATQPMDLNQGCPAGKAHAWHTVFHTPENPKHAGWPRYLQHHAVKPVSVSMFQCVQVTAPCHISRAPTWAHLQPGASHCPPSCSSVSSTVLQGPLTQGHGSILQAFHALVCIPPTTQSPFHLWVPSTIPGTPVFGGTPERGLLRSVLQVAPSLAPPLPTQHTLGNREWAEGSPEERIGSDSFICLRLESIVSVLPCLGGSWMCEYKM